MKSKFRIDIPCSVKWDEMEDLGVDKFCSKCEKTVFDFSKKSETEISELLNTMNNVCAKINIKKNLLLSLSIILTLNISSCSTQNLAKENIENIHTQDSFVKGKINVAYSNKVVENAEINIITKDKVYRTFSDSLGNFSLKIPTNIIKKNLLFYINYREIKNGKPFFQNQRSEQFVLTEEQISKPIKLSYHNYATIGEVRILQSPINRYFINGKKVSEKTFDNINHPENGFWIHLDNYDEKKAVVGRTFFDNVYLFYSNDFIISQ